MIVEWGLPVATAAVSAVLTAWYRQIALARGLLDVPNERSSHRCAVPRGGGIAIVSAFTIAAVLLWVLGRLPTSVFAALVGGGSVVAAVGLLDDFRTVSRRTRILVHFAAAFWALAWLGGLPPTQVGQLMFDPGIAGFLPAALLLVWVLNLYNFMDGIDGIASVETMSIAGFAAIHLALAGRPTVALGPACLAAASAGFIFWNWPPARIFMGDTGSGYLGFVIGVFALGTTSTGAMTLWTWIILLGVFLSDSTLTLSARLLRRERWYSAHRTHAYQRMALRCGSHARVTLSVLAINLLWLWPLAAVSESHREAGWWLSIAALAPLFGLAWLAGAGRRERTGGRSAPGTP